MVKRVKKIKLMQMETSIQARLETYSDLTPVSRSLGELIVEVISFIYKNISSQPINLISYYFSGKQYSE
jgi:hypothetical protein